MHQRSDQKTRSAFAHEPAVALPSLAGLPTAGGPAESLFEDPPLSGLNLTDRRKVRNEARAVVASATKFSVWMEAASILISDSSPETIQAFDKAIRNPFQSKAALVWIMESLDVEQFALLGPAGVALANPGVNTKLLNAIHAVIELPVIIFGYSNSTAFARSSLALAILEHASQVAGRERALETLMGSYNFDLRHKAASLLGPSSLEAHKILMKGLLLSEAKVGIHTSARARSIQALAADPSEVVSEKLISLALREYSDHGRKALAKAFIARLTAIDDERAVQVIVGLLKDPIATIREFAPDSTLGSDAIRFLVSQFAREVAKSPSVLKRHPELKDALAHGHKADSDEL